MASKGAALALLARLVLVLGGPRPAIGSSAALVSAVTWCRSWPSSRPLTATFGNLAAYGQTNLKRLLAYSTIAHAGYMMMGLATLTREGAGAVLFYLVAYLFMNLGAFAVVAFLRNLTGSEDLADFRGLVYRCSGAGGHPGGLPAQPARHAAAGRFRGQVSDLQRPVRRRHSRSAPAASCG